MFLLCGGIPPRGRNCPRLVKAVSELNRGIWVISRSVVFGNVEEKNKEYTFATVCESC